MSGLPKLKPKYTSRWGADLGQNSCPELLSMSRTRGRARSECSESSQEVADRDEERHSRKAFREYIQGCVERFLETGRNSLSVKPYKKVANYFVGRMLGEGTFGKVKLAIHVLAGVKVAVKVYSKNQAVDSYVLQNVSREVKLLQRIQHHNIVRLFDFIETENNYYLVTEYCSNGSLLDLVVMRGSIEEGESREYLRQIISAVDCLHYNNIIHRDIKLENLLLTSSMTVKLIDFGLSADEGSQTQCGSPLYAAPEMLGAKRYGKEVDIWSIGVCFYMLLMGTPPYQPDTTGGMAGLTLLHAKMLDGRMNRIKDNISANCQNLIMGMLCYDPQKRITIEEIQKHSWVTVKGFHPLPPASACNVMTHEDLNQFVLGFMDHSECMRGQSKESLILDILDNKCTGATSTYHLLEKSYQQWQARIRTPLSSITCKRSSSDNCLMKKAGPPRTATTSDSRRVSESQLPPLPRGDKKVSSKKPYSTNKRTVTQSSHRNVLPKQGVGNQALSTGKRPIRARHLSRERELPPNDLPKVSKERRVKEYDPHPEPLETIVESRQHHVADYDMFTAESNLTSLPSTDEMQYTVQSPQYSDGTIQRRPQTQDKWLWKRTYEKTNDRDMLPDIDRDDNSGRQSLDTLPFEEWIELSNGDCSSSRDN